MKGRLLARSLLAFLVPVAAEDLANARGDAPTSPDSATYDCGTLALRILLKLENRPSDPAFLETRLPRRNPRGYTMNQLRHAAGECGLELIGVHLSSHGGELDRPALVFQKVGTHGHFLVVRPIGPTGKLLQVLDPNRPPEVVDAQDFFAAPEWTGLALVPRRSNRLTLALAGLAAAAALASFAVRRTADNRKKQSALPPSLLLPPPSTSEPSP